MNDFRHFDYRKELPRSTGSCTADEQCSTDTYHKPYCPKQIRDLAAARANRDAFYGK